MYANNGNINVLDYQNQKTDPDEEPFMKIVMNPNGTLTEIDPRTNKMLPIKPQNMKIVKLDMNKTHSFIQNDARALEK